MEISSKNIDNRMLYLDALLKGDRKKCSAVAKQYSNSKEDIKELYQEVIKPSLYKVGELWEYNIITVASEHLATSITESVLNELYESVIADVRLSKKIVLGCIEEELHQVGIKMVADIFEMKGWDTFFLGANVPNRELINYTKTVAPNVIALSVSIYSHIPNLESLLIDFRRVFLDIPIIIGGQAFIHGGEEIFKPYKNVVLCKSIEEIETYINYHNNEKR